MMMPLGQERTAWEGRFSPVFPWVKWSGLFGAEWICEILVACGEHFQNRRKAELSTYTKCLTLICFDAWRSKSEIYSDDRLIGVSPYTFNFI